MKYYRVCLLSVLLLAFGAAASAQQSRPKRPVKNPPQYPSIIDLENKDQKPAQPKQEDKQAAATTIDPDALTRAFTIIAEELKSLSQEVKALNLRQQLEVELMRMSKIEQRIATYENELRPVRERIAALEADEQTLQQMLTRDSLLAQTANMASINREATMNQLRYQHEARLQNVQAEKERLRVLEANQMESLTIYQKMSDEIDRKIQQAEEKLQQLESSKNGTTQPNSNQEKP